MPSYPVSIRRCQHIKVNGTQCGSPALRDEKCCYYHMRWRAASKFVEDLRKREIAGLPILEDANSIQVGLAEVMFQLVTQEIDHRTAALMLYALQTASANLRMTSFEPEPTRVVIDRESVERRPIGASAWSKVEGREYDDLTEDDSAPIKDKDPEGNDGQGDWRYRTEETPANERLLPGESQEQRRLRVLKQRAAETGAQ
jgi:hypothetical protein